MRRSICIVEPNISYAGEVFTWKFSYTTASTLPKGTRIKFDLQSKGREGDWEVPNTNLKEKKNLIWGVMPDGKTISAKPLDSPSSPVPDFEFVLPGEIKTGETFTIYLGTPHTAPEKIKQSGSRCQTAVQRRKSFLLHIDPKGKGDYKESETFNMDIKGNILSNIRAVVPSLLSKNKRFDVILRFEDQYGNLTSNAPEGTLIELSYEHLRQNLNWKLFVPETGFLALPNLYFNEPGMYRVQLKNLKTQEKFYSDPILCFPEQDNGIFWGSFHFESEKVDAAEDIESCLRHLRDEKSLQFFSTSSFESATETPNETWKNISHHVAELNEDHRFTTFLGMQWFQDSPEEGLRQLVFAKDNKPILRKKEAKNSNLKKIYKSCAPKELLSIPSFSMAKGFGTDFSEFSPEFERVVEIYNAWGSSECLAKEGNPRPISFTGKKGVGEFAAGSIRKALANNCRFGFVAGGLDDRDLFGSLYENEQTQYSPGLTAIICAEQTRDALFQALYHRRCYATTGERIILGFFIAGAMMGSELNTKAKPGLVYNRHITGYVAGTKPLQSIEIIRNGTVLHTLTSKDSYLEFTYDDAQLITQAGLAPSRTKDKSTEDHPFTYYYLRVTQSDGHIAWSSPIWIDIHEALLPAVKKPKKK